MIGRILVLNSGSSSIKFALYTATAAPVRVLHGMIAELGTSPRFSANDENGAPLQVELPVGNRDQPLTYSRALRWLFDWLTATEHGRQLLGVGHRVVHGGERYAEPVLVDAEVFAYLERLTPMAPLHQPHDLGAIRTLMSAHPELPQVACFDTEFHRTMPIHARTFALPRELTAAGIRRYGFHGLSYEYVSGVLPEYLGPRADARVVVAHLGNGASMCAMRARRSVATTMGMTALDGLVMGTRSGAIDPGVIFYLMRDREMSAEEVEGMLYHRSGLLGVSGLSSDMRELLASDSPGARESVELFAYAAARALASLAAALGGLDALVFTAGIGERAAKVRAMISEQAQWMGVELDTVANDADRAVISTAASRVAVCVIPTNEEIVIARHTCRLLGIAPPAHAGA